MIGFGIKISQSVCRTRRAGGGSLQNSGRAPGNVEFMAIHFCFSVGMKFIAHRKLYLAASAGIGDLLMP